MIPLILFELWATLKFLHDNNDNDNNDDDTEVAITIIA